MLQLISDTNQNLRVLEDQASLAMDLFQCKNINDLYVNTVHEAGCTYSVNAIAWMLACSIIISVCGLIMIMLRSSYIPEQFLIMSSEWKTNPAITRSASEESRSSNAGDQGISPGVPSHRSSTEIQNSQQLSGVPQSVPMPSTPPTMFIDCNSDSVECSSELNSQQRSPISSAAINSNDDNMMPGSAEI